MEILVGIDDTDNLESPGTGHLAEMLRSDLEKLYGGKTSRITRPSALCFSGNTLYLS